MKFRQEKPSFSESDEQALAREIRELTGTQGSGSGRELPDAYWQNLLVKTNRRIDKVSSPKAISISWAWRVAVPGVVAIISFLIGLHYYAPVRQPVDSGLNAAVLSLPEQEVDSVLTASAHEENAQAATVGEDVFTVSRDQIAEYLIENGKETLLVESLDDKQAVAFLDALAQR